MYRIGNGYDVHRLVEGRELILGGVTIPFEKGLLGHSDADVLIHAVIDALLGALALGDIGKHFPDTDPRFLGVSSQVLIQDVSRLVLGDMWVLGNLDATICAEKPKLQAYIPAMRTNLASYLNCDVSQISIKATTEEGLGVSGQGAGISAYCSLLLRRKS